MTSRASKARRRKPAATARLRPFWLAFVGVAVLAGAGVYAAQTLPVFRPRTIRVSGAHVVPAHMVLERAAIDASKNMWLQDSSAIAKRVEAIPYVGDVRIERAWPGIETIAVTERTPYAAIPNPGGRLLVDRDLRVLEIGGVGRGLPELEVAMKGPFEPGMFLSDPGVAALRNDNEALQGAQISARTLAHDKYGDLVVVLHDGVRVLFGDEADLAKKIPLVDPILTQVGRAGRPIVAIDLRAETTPVVVYKR